MTEQEMILELYKKEKREAILTCIASLCFIAISIGVLFSYDNMEEKIILCVIAILVCVIAMFTSTGDLLLLKKAINKQKYSYYCLDIERYIMTFFGPKIVYNLCGIKYVRTNIRGAKKVHVFDCGNQYLTIVEKPEVNDAKES